MFLSPLVRTALALDVLGRKPDYMRASQASSPSSSSLTRVSRSQTSASTPSSMSQLTVPTSTSSLLYICAHIDTQTRFGRVDTQLNSIKGGGACQLREKVLAEAATT